METIQAIMTRRSIRKYDGRPISGADLGALLRADVVTCNRW